jgi:hypothetical protein
MIGAAVLLLAAWMLGVAVIAVNERLNLGDTPDLWVGSRLLWVLILGWPVSLALYVAMGPFLGEDDL